jgi:divalent metal cation (Fe/Co/Zn/Cd) transporter
MGQSRSRRHRLDRYWRDPDGGGYLSRAETKALLLGERADRAVGNDTRDIAGSEESVTRINNPLTMHFGPRQILLNREVEFRPDLTAPQIAAAIDRLETSIRSKHPEINRIFIEARSLRTVTSVVNAGHDPVGVGHQASQE